jgi:hypothetical protein
LALLMWLASSSATICPGLVSPFDTPLLWKEEFTEDLSLLRIPMQVGARDDELSIFAAAVSVIAMEDLLQQASDVTLLSETDGLTAFSSATVDVIPGDTAAVYGVTGVPVVDILAANGWQALPRMTSRSLGSLGPLLQVGLYVPTYTLGNLSKMYDALGLPPMSQDLGLASSAAARAFLSLREPSIASLVENTIIVPNKEVSLAGSILCDEADVLSSLGRIPASNFTGIPRFNITGSEGTEKSAHFPATQSMLQGLGLNATLTCTKVALTIPQLEDQLAQWNAAYKHYIVLGWSTWSVIETLGLQRLALPAYDPTLFFTTRNSDFAMWTTVRKHAGSRFEVRYIRIIVRYTHSSCSHL